MRTHNNMRTHRWERELLTRHSLFPIHAHCAAGQTRRLNSSTHDVGHQEVAPPPSTTPTVNTITGWAPLVPLIPPPPPPPAILRTVVSAATGSTPRPVPTPSSNYRLAPIGDQQAIRVSRDPDQHKEQLKLINALIQIASERKGLVVLSRRDDSFNQLVSTLEGSGGRFGLERGVGNSLEEILRLMPTTNHEKGGNEAVTVLDLRSLQEVKAAVQSCRTQQTASSSSGFAGQQHQQMKGSGSNSTSSGEQQQTVPPPADRTRIRIVAHLVELAEHQEQKAEPPHRRLLLDEIITSVRTAVGNIEAKKEINRKIHEVLNVCIMKGGSGRLDLEKLKALQNQFSYAERVAQRRRKNNDTQKVIDALLSICDRQKVPALSTGGMNLTELSRAVAQHLEESERLLQSRKASTTFLHEISPSKKGVTASAAEQQQVKTMPADVVRERILQILETPFRDGLDAGLIQALQAQQAANQRGNAFSTMMVLDALYEIISTHSSSNRPPPLSDAGGMSMEELTALVAKGRGQEMVRTEIETLLEGYSLQRGINVTLLKALKERLLSR